MSNFVVSNNEYCHIDLPMVLGYLFKYINKLADPTDFVLSKRFVMWQFFCLRI